MKTTVLLFLATALFASANAQYDSLQNIPVTKSSLLIGQKVTVLENFDLFTDNAGHHKATDNVLNKRYAITAAVKDANVNQVWLQLSSDSDTAYFRLTTRNYDSAPFIVMGYFEKQKRNYLAKTLQPKFEYRTAGKTYTTKDVFTCTNVTIVNRNNTYIPCVILRSSNNDEIQVPIKGFERTLNDNTDRFNKL